MQLGFHKKACKIFWGLTFLENSIWSYAQKSILQALDCLELLTPYSCFALESFSLIWAEPLVWVTFSYYVQLQLSPHLFSCGPSYPKQKARHWKRLKNTIGSNVMGTIMTWTRFQASSTNFRFTTESCPFVKRWRLTILTHNPLTPVEQACVEQACIS